MMQGEYNLKYVVSQEIAQKFIEISNDNNLMHVSDCYARERGFQGKISHGNILNCFLSHFVGVALGIDNIIIHSQEIEYRNPFFTGDSLDFKAILIESYDSLSTYVYQFSFRGNGQLIAKGKVQVGILK